MIRRFFERCARELGLPQHRIDRYTTYQLAGAVLWEQEHRT